MSSTATKNPIINRVNGNGSSNGVSSQNIARDLRRGITAGVLALQPQLLPQPVLAAGVAEFFDSKRISSSTIFFIRLTIFQRDLNQDQ